LVVLQQCTNYNVETADEISKKFAMGIIFWTGSCFIIQLYLLGGANSTRMGKSRWPLPQISCWSRKDCM